jgi:hypothetical protein
MDDGITNKVEYDVVMENHTSESIEFPPSKKLIG